MRSTRVTLSISVRAPWARAVRKHKGDDCECISGISISTISIISIISIRGMGGPAYGRVRVRLFLYISLSASERLHMTRESERR